jgi:hypothetical protein
MHPLSQLFGKSRVNQAVSLHGRLHETIDSFTCPSKGKKTYLAHECIGHDTEKEI